MIKRSLAIATLLMTTMVFPAFAASLDAAKAQGLVGERTDGYIGAVAGGGEAASVVDEINRLRRQEYEKIAANNGQSISVVEKLAAQKLLSRVQPGQYYMDASGSWKKK